MDGLVLVVRLLVFVDRASRLERYLGELVIVQHCQVFAGQKRPDIPVLETVGDDEVIAALRTVVLCNLNDLADRKVVDAARV